jgi:hypothetical protein
MKTKIALLLVFAGLIFSATKVSSQDKNFHIYLCLGQSNMEGNARIQAQDTVNIDPRFMVLCSYNVPDLYWLTYIVDSGLR